MTIGSAMSVVLTIWLLSMCLFAPTISGFALERPRPATINVRNGHIKGGRLQSFRSLGAGQPKSQRLTSLGTSLSVMASMQQDEGTAGGKKNLRARLRQLTGFSLTALRATLRAATGISITAVWASTFAATGAWIRQTMRLVLAPFPAWFRYFLQPFLVLYYAPLFIVRNLTSPSRNERKRKHELFVEGWKHAVEVADESSSYFPLHVSKDKDGAVFESDMEELDINEAISEAVQVSLEKEEGLEEDV